VKSRDLGAGREVGKRKMEGKILGRKIGKGVERRRRGKRKKRVRKGNKEGGGWGRSTG